MSSAFNDTSKELRELAKSIIAKEQEKIHQKKPKNMVNDIMTLITNYAENNNEEDSC